MNREDLHDTGSTSHLYRDIIVSPFGYLLEAAGQFPSFFDHEERRLLLTSLAIGLVVWGVVYSLELGVHFLFEMTMQWVETAGGEVFVFVPLLLGAMAVAWLSRRRSTKIDYRDSEGHVHELNDVEGDGLERTIALNDRAIAERYAGHIGDGVERPADAFERQSQAPAAQLA